jgi:hypothetical protein
MRNATTASPTQREPELLGQTVVVIGRREDKARDFVFNHYAP